MPRFFFIAGAYGWFSLLAIGMKSGEELGTLTIPVAAGMVAVMTVEQIFSEIKALSARERERLFRRMQELEGDEIPKDFLEALADFGVQRFVTMETALDVGSPRINGR